LTILVSFDQNDENRKTSQKVVGGLFPEERKVPTNSETGMREEAALGPWEASF